MSARSFCDTCNGFHPSYACETYTSTNLDVYKNKINQLNRELERQIISNQELEDVIRVLHHNCDPTNMTFNDHLIWEVWNRKFHPENYEENS